MRNEIKGFLAAIFGLIIIATAFLLPAFGSFQNKHVANYYLENGLEDTGSANLVNAIVWDYRGYDTLGEETILFVAVMGIFVVIGGVKKWIL
jgi:multisubunit Na+/H+ antiporter MnhB subunit